MCVSLGANCQQKNAQRADRLRWASTSRVQLPRAKGIDWKYQDISNRARIDNFTDFIPYHFFVRTGELRKAFEDGFCEYMKD